MRALRILIIDDDETTLMVTERRLAQRGHTVESRNETIGATNAIRKFAPDAVLIDVNMPAMSGYKLVELIQQARLPTKLVIFSSIDRAELETAAVSTGVAGFVHKDDAATVGERLEAIVRSDP